MSGGPSAGQRSPFLAFFSTLPGIIAAVAALITALVTAGIIVVNTTSDAPGSGTTDPGIGDNGNDPAPEPETFYLPSVIGLDRETSYGVLQEAGVPNYTDITYEEVPVVEEWGVVIDQDPPEGEYAFATPVTVYIGGPSEATPIP